MDIQFYYAGENAEKVYAPFVPALTAAFKQSTHHSSKWQWDKGNNTLRVLLVTPKDIDPQEGYKKLDWSVMGGCVVPATKATVDMSEYLSEKTQKLYQLLMMTASHQDGFMYGAKLREALLRNPAAVLGAIGTVTSSVMEERATASNISLHTANLEIPMMIVSLKDRLETGDEVAKKFSGLGTTHISKLIKTPEEYMTFTLGHEIIGHGVGGHVGDETAAAKYTCSELNYDITDRGAVHEAESDIAGTMTHRVAQVIAGNQDDVSIGPEIEALRAISNIMQTPNRYGTSVTSDIHGHITTVHFDPAQKDYKGAFANSVDLRGFTSIPPLLATLSDILTGYVYARTMEDRVKKKDKALTKGEREDFGEVTKKPEDHISAFVEVGSKVRYGSEADDKYSEIVQNPAWVVASIRYLKKSGGVDAIKAQLRPALRPVVDDMVNDFLRAADMYGSPLLLTNDIMLFERYLPKHVNYKAILNEVMDLPVPVQSKGQKAGQPADVKKSDLPHHPVPRHILSSYVPPNP